MKPHIRSIGESPFQPGTKLWNCIGSGTTGVYTSATGYSPSVAYYAWLHQQIEMTANRTWSASEPNIRWWEVLCGAH